MAASEVAGFIASALVLLTFAMTDMRLLRITAILSNFAFIAYGQANFLAPVLILHLLLLPVNLLQLFRLALNSKEQSRLPVVAAEKAAHMAQQAVQLSIAARSKPRSASISRT